MNIKLVPTLIIKLKDLDDYTTIISIFKENNIRRYLYKIIYINDIIKIGIQHTWTEKTYADRIYTQIGWMPGWNKPRLNRGRKTGKATEEMINKVNPEFFHKDDIILEIYDYTNHNFVDEDCSKLVYAEMQNAEERAKREYYNLKGRYPVGNIKQEPMRGISMMANLDNLFEFV